MTTDPHAGTELDRKYRPPVDYDLHHLAGIGYHLAIGLDLDRYEADETTDEAWYVTDVPPVAGPGKPAEVRWFADQADAFVYAVNRLLEENEAETGDTERRIAATANPNR